MYNTILPEFCKYYRSTKANGTEIEMMDLMPKSNDVPQPYHCSNFTLPKQRSVLPFPPEGTLHPEIEKALDAVQFIADHLHRDDQENQVTTGFLMVLF